MEMSPKPAPVQKMSVHDRLDAIERRLGVFEANLDLCLSYIREIAKERMTAERIAEIEKRIPR
jgi:hypothetical protein